jgi:hypothetical protein
MRDEERAHRRACDHEKFERLDEDEQGAAWAHESDEHAGSNAYDTDYDTHCRPVLRPAVREFGAAALALPFKYLIGRSVGALYGIRAGLDYTVVSRAYRAQLGDDSNS